jgi:hypothetical protein
MGIVEAMDRRDFLRVAGTIGGVVMLGSLEPWERLNWALQRPSAIDQRVVDDLEAVTVALAKLEREIQAPRLLLNPVTVHLDSLMALLRGNPGTTVHRQLCSLAAEAAALAGWLRWDLGDMGGAAGYFKAGLKATQEAGDTALGAYLLGSLASAPFYQERPERRLRILGQAAGATPHTAAWLRTLEAGAYALSGRLGDFQMASDAAKELLVRTDSEESRPRTPFFGVVYLAEEEAAGYLRLGMPATAAGTLHQVLDQAQGRMRLWLHADLAYAAAAEGETELAVQYAMEILGQAQADAIEPVMENLRRLPDALPSKLDPAAVAYIEALGLV